MYRPAVVKIKKKFKKNFMATKFYIFLKAFYISWTNLKQKNLNFFLTHAAIWRCQ